MRFENSRWLVWTILGFGGSAACGGDAPIESEPLGTLSQALLGVSACPAGYRVIQGTSGADTLTGTAGNDCILGHGGNDVINGGGGNDYVFGGAGNDQVRGGAGDDYLAGELGDDTLLGEAGNDTAYGGEGSDSIDGGAGNDRLHGTDGDFGQTGDDTIEGGDGNDNLTGGAGNDRLSGGAGNDILEGFFGNDLLSGGAGNDTLAGGGGDDQVAGGAGNDIAEGGDGNDVIDGQAGNDTLRGGAGNDAIESAAGDSVDGGAGTDACTAPSCERAKPGDCTSSAQCGAAQSCLSTTGTCLGCSSSAQCNDGDACTADSCDIVLGCAHTDTLTCQPPAPEFRLLAAAWDGAQEIVSEIDPMSGTSTQLGVLSGLTWWSNELVFDEQRGRLFATGMNGAFEHHLYSFDLATGATTAVPSPIPYLYLAGVAASGQPITVWWDGDAGLEKVGYVDPATGAVSEQGDLGDLYSWTGSTAYDQDNHVVYAVGMTRQGIDDWKLYGFDLDTHTLTTAPLAHRYLELAGVNGDGHLIALKAHNIPELVADVFDLDPASGATLDRGRIDGLRGWMSIMSYDRDGEQLYTLADAVGSVQTLYSFDVASGTTSTVPFNPGPINWAFAKY